MTINAAFHDSSAILLSVCVGEAAFSKDNNCLNAAKACNLNDTCKKYRSAYISPCTSRVSTTEVCNKRKCHKALRQFFDKVPAKHSYGMLFCSCPSGEHSACSERRRQTIVPACSYEDKDKPNCLSLQASCKTNYICRWAMSQLKERVNAGFREVVMSLRVEVNRWIITFPNVSFLPEMMAHHSYYVFHSLWGDLIQDGFLFIPGVLY